MAFPESIRLIDPDDGSEKIVHINQVPTGIYVYGSVGSYMLGPWATIDAWNYYAVRGPDAGTQAPEDGESVAIVHEGRIVQSYVLGSGPGRWWPRIPESDGPREIQRPRRRIRLAMMPSDEAYLQALFAGRVTLPEGSRVVNAFHDHHTRSVGFVVQNDAFEECPEGYEAKRLQLYEEIARDGSYSLTYEAG